MYKVVLWLILAPLIAQEGEVEVEELPFTMKTTCSQDPSSLMVEGVDTSVVGPALCCIETWLQRKVSVYLCWKYYK